MLCENCILLQENTPSRVGILNYFFYCRFNGMNSKVRELNQLKQQWRTMKLEAKRGISQYKSSLKKTGGGEKPPSPKADHVVILELLPQEFEEGSNCYDCDGREVSV